MNTPEDEQAWDDLFRQRLEHYEAEPAADALGRILAGTPKPVRINRRRVAGRVAVSLLLLIGMSWWALNRWPMLPEQPAAVKTSPVGTARKSTLPSGSASSPTTPERSPSSTLVNPDQSVAVNKPSVREREATFPTNNTFSYRSPGKSRQARVAGSVRYRQPATYRGRIRPTDATYPDWDDSSTDLVNVLTEVASVAEPAPLTIGRLQHLGLRLPQMAPPAAPISAQQTHLATSPAVSRRRRSSVYASVMALYSYRRISPNTNDEVYIRQIQSSRTFSSDRIGSRIQIGKEWRLSQRIGLRAGLTYGQLRTSMRYRLRTLPTDSTQVNWVNDQTVRLTPMADRPVAVAGRYHYVGLNTDLIVSLGSGQLWSHYLTAGATVGGYVAPVRRQGAFLQASYGIERPLTSDLWLRIEPSVQYGLNAVSDRRNLCKIRPYTYGLTISFRK
ncbi:hypothetical protein DYU11_04035 [Fibrisoma montanum]|uniref:Outer membrane protein beta-barrel domain-containing protein n=1 Tax=Fibrisoma montanum TaxID=2305895 RepID=A0A418MJG1_9BACT|nr:hypothetical protein [Fibrisoma montanum]RIV27483.1 hypothetical protein DYU11_04035 [Fibrisoma montanum]